MQVIFKDKYLQDLYEGQSVKGKPKYSENVLDKFAIKILKLINSKSLWLYLR